MTGTSNQLSLLKEILQTTNPLRIVVPAAVVTEASDSWYVILMGCHQYPDESRMFFMK
jgi:hypothetical protein